jgi:tetratricopeptide (TPR) repeat protein
MIRVGKNILILYAALLLVAVPSACKKKKVGNTNAPAPVKPAAKVALVPEGLDAPAYFSLGMDATKGDRDDEAAEAFEHAIKLQPEFAEAHLRLALSYDVLLRNTDADKEYRTAIDQYKKQLSSGGKEATDWFNLGTAYSKLKRFDEAVAAFQQATRLKKDYAEAFFELGDSLIKTARYADAVNALKKAIDLDPDNYEAKDALEKAQDGQARIDSEIKQQKGAGKRNKNANLPDENNVNANKGGGNSGGGNNNGGGGSNGRKPKPFQ